MDHLRPQRWNLSAIIRQLDRRLVEQTDNILVPTQIFSLRYFWLDGFFAAVSENFYLSFIPLFALAFGATSGQVGWLTAVANLAGAVALFPGARLAERGRKKARTNAPKDPADPSDPTDQIPQCPQCGAAMVLRTAKTGKNEGKQFWGCSADPECKGVVNI